MSLILEALKRSEAERRLGEAPDLLAPAPEFAGMAPARTVPLGLIAVFTTALVLVIGFAWWWFALREAPALAPRMAAVTDASDDEAGVSPRGPSTVSDGTPALLGIPPNAIPQPQPSIPERTPAAASTVVPDPTAPLLPPDTVVGSSPVPVEPQATPTAIAPVAPPSPASVPTPTTQPATAVVDPAGAGVSSADPNAPAMPAPSPESSTPPEVVQESPASNLPDLSDLPLAVRQALPPLVLNMHLYRATPADRVVILDGQRLGEGGMAGDIQVAEIRSDGVVLVAKGQRFLLSRLPR